MFNLISLGIGAVTLVMALIAFVPLLGWANWLIVPLAVVGPVMSISGWWTRWVERNVSALIVRLRNPTIWSRPWYSYFPPL